MPKYEQYEWKYQVSEYLASTNPSVYLAYKPKSVQDDCIAMPLCFPKLYNSCTFGLCMLSAKYTCTIKRYDVRIARRIQSK